MSSRIFIKLPPPLRFFDSGDPVQVAQLDRMRRWNQRMAAELTTVYDDYTKNTADRTKLDEKLAEVVAGYDANCMLDASAHSTRFQQIMNLWDPAIEEEPWLNRNGVLVIVDIIHYGALTDVFAEISYNWVDEDSIKLWIELLTAFEKSPLQHNLFNNAYRMAYLLIDAALRAKMIHLVVWMSYLSDDTWRAICTLALTDRIPSHLARWTLQEICYRYALHAITDDDANILNDHSVQENVAIREAFRNQGQPNDVDWIRGPLTQLDSTIEGILKIIESGDNKVIADIDPTFNHSDYDWLDDGVFEHLEQVLWQAGRRFCRGMVFRIVVALVSLNPQLPQYAILPIVEKTLPYCIFTNQAEEVSGMISRREAVALIESVMRFYSTTKAMNESRSTRQRLWNDDDDN